MGLGNVENVTLSSWSGSSNLNTLGTINTLVVDNACSVGGLTTKANIGHINDPGLLTLSSGFLNVDGDVVIDGNLTIHGTETTINSTTITINDVFIELAEENNGDATDFGIVGQYNSSGVKYAGLFRDHSDKRFKFVKDLTTLPVSNISSYTKANLEVDNLYGDVTGDITGNLTGNVTGNVSGTAASVTTAAQTAITSVGTLTSLNVSGNVGIGDTTPSYKLDVNGTGRFTGDLTSNGFTCSRLTTSVTGTFGSVQTRGTGEGLYDGYSIDGNFVFMAYNADNLFIHNDVDNQHIWRYHRTGQKHSFYVAGGEKMTIDSNGNVGIGQSINLQHKLYVNGTSKFMDDLTCNAGFSCSGLTNTITGSRGSVETKEIYNRWAGYSIDGNFVFTAWDANNLYIYNDVDNQNIWRYDRTNSRHSFYNAGSTKMTIDSNGNVGIGDSTPSYKLDVAGDINLTGSLRINGTAQTFGGGSSIWSESSSEAYYAGNVGIGNTNPAYKLDVSGTGRFTGNLTCSGYVGIGTNNPDKKLHILGSSNEIAHFERDDGNAATIKFSNTASSEGAIIGLSSTEHLELANLKTNKDIIFKTNNTEIIRVDNGGNVGIGTNSPTYKLDVNGTGRFTGNLTCNNFTGANAGITMSGYIGRSTTQTGFLCGINSSSHTSPIYCLSTGHTPNETTLSNMYGIGYCSGSASFITGTGSGLGMYVAADGDARVFLGANSSSVSYINTTGNFGLGTDSPSYKLDVAGTGRFTGNLTCNNFTGANAGITMSGYIGRSTTQTGFLCGINSSSHTSPIYCLSTGHTPNETTLSNMYGIGYCSGSASFITGTGSGLGMYVAADGDARVFLGANSSSVSYINTTGNFGLGTDSPSYKLDVAGTGRFTGDLTCDSDFITNKLLLEGGTSQYPYIEAKGAGNPKGIGFFTENTEKMRIHKNGNVGIGTTNPAEKLHVDGNVKIENGYYTGTEAGIHLKTIVLTHDDLSGELDLPVPSNFNKPSLTTNTWYNLVYFEYTPVSTSSYLIIESNLVYEISGYGTDKFESRIDVNSVITLHTNKQNFNNNKGGGGRSGCLFPIKARYTNTNDNNKVIEFFFRRTSGDDEIEFDVNNIFVQVTEITR